MPKIVEASLHDTLRDAVGQDNAAQRAYEQQHVELMNSVADATVRSSPTTDLGAFLFAMHGIEYTDWDRDKSEEQKRYENLEGLFGLNGLRRVFSTHGIWRHEARADARPYHLHMVSRSEFDDYMRSDRSDRRNDFSAVKYVIEGDINHKGDLFAYKGNVIVPAFSIKFPSDSEAKVEPTNLNLLDVDRHIDQPAPRQKSFAGGDYAYEEGVRFGTDIGHYRKDGYHITKYIDELQLIAEAEEALERAIDEQSKAHQAK